MKTVMLTAFLVLVSALTSAGQAPASPAPGNDGPDYEALGRSVVLELAAGRFDKVEAQFDPRTTEAMPQDKLEESWKGLIAQVGAFKEITASHVEPVQGYQRVKLACTFEKATLDAAVVFDTSGKIVGLGFTPSQPKIAWTAPGYANASAFEEKPLTVVDGKWELPGTLTMPRKDGPFPTRSKEGLVPGVVLVQGSGPQDEDETIGPNKAFKDLAWGLGSNGVAVLRYVKRTQQYGVQSSTEPNALTVNDETVDDARAAAALLAKQPGIDPRRVYVVGHSLGGMMGPRIASGDAAIAGLILLAGNTRPLEVLILDQLRYIATLQREPKDKEEVRQRITAAEETAREIESPDLKPGMMVSVLGTKAPASYFLDLRDYHPAEVAAKLTIPILILQGGRDYQVTSADFEGWQKALAGHSNATLKMYPAMSHLFIAGTGAASPEDYKKPGHVSEEVIRDMAAWIATGKVAPGKRSAGRCKMSDNPLAQMLWFLIAEIGMIGAMLYLLPTLTRRDIFFAVTVPTDFRGTEEAKGILRRFRAALLVHTVVAVALTAAGFAFDHLWLLLAGVYWQCFGAFLAFLSGRRKVLPHAAAPSQVHEAVLAPREPGPLGHRMLQVGPFAIMTATCLYLYARWESLPVRFPVHWGIDGKPNRWATRSFLGVYGAMLTGFVICGGMALLAYAILHWSREVRATGAAAVNEDKFRNTQLGILLGAEYFIAVLFSWIALMPLRQSQEMGASMAVILLATLAFVGVVFVAVIHTGQGGANLADAGAGATGSIPEAAPIGDRTPDRCWKGGMIYYNPDDPAVLVEKRFGIGYTLNFGNGRSWLVLGGIVLVPLILALVLTHTH